MTTYEKAWKLMWRLRDISQDVFVTVDDIMNKATPAQINFYFRIICEGR